MNESMGLFGSILPLVLLFVVMYFFLIKPQKKREKQINEMRNNIQVGDEVITIGGICGKIVKTKDETLVIQVGADRTKFEIMRWAVSKVVSSNEKASSKRETVEEEVAEAPKKSLPKRMKKTEVPAEVSEPVAETVAEPVENTEEK